MGKNDAGNDTGKNTGSNAGSNAGNRPWRQGKRFFFLTAVVAFFLGYMAVAMALPATPAWKPEDLEADFNTFIYDREGKLIAVLQGLEDRFPLPGEIPQVVKDAFVATEDVRFYRHNGIDPEAILRAMIVNFREGRIAEGASTITQQLVKNSLLTSEKTYERKIKEILLALDMEKKYSKEEILNMYLNRIYFGHGAYGLEAAARTYFGKTAKDLNLPEAALLAGLPKAPNRYSPFREPEAARQRMNTVLSLMAENGLITPEQEEQARKEGYRLLTAPLEKPYEFPYFVDNVVEEAGERLGISEKDIYGGGLRIYTTLDRKVQQAAQSVWADERNFPPTGKNKRPVQGAVAVVDYHNGEIKALVGGRDYDAKRGFNRAVDSRRQPGSTFKPVAVYGPALEARYPPYMVLDDSPVSFGEYTPQNYSGGFKGSMTMASALKYSVNVWAVKMLDKLGVEAGYNFARKLGFDLAPEDKVLPLALGGLTNGVSPLQMASGYGAFANAGILVEPHSITKITDASGAVLFDGRPKASKVMEPHTAYVMTDLLQDVVRGGTGTRARMDRPVAGKTGTTQLPDSPEFEKIAGNKDAWFVGYTPELVAAVWIGYDRTDRDHYLRGVVGGSYPARLWKKVMEKALDGAPKKDFPEYKGKFKYRRDVRVWSPDTPEKTPEKNGSEVPDNGGAAAPVPAGEDTQGASDSDQDNPDNTQGNPNSGQGNPDNGQGNPNNGQGNPDNDQGNPDNGQGPPAAGQDSPGNPESGQGVPGTPAGGQNSPSSPSAGGEAPQSSGNGSEAGN